MGDLKKIFGQAGDLWTKMSKGRRVVLLGALAGTVALIAVLSSRPPEKYGVLFSGLAAEDAGAVVEALKAAKVPYKVTGGGGAVEIPEAQVHEVRLLMAQKGMPRGGSIGFEVFDKQSFGATSFVEQMNYRRALQGELARTIMSLEEVQGARVHIAMPERSVYATDKEQPSASVALRLRQGRALSPGQVRGIAHLVASSVDRLSPDRVTVVDENGNVMGGGGDDDGGGQLEAQQQLEKAVSRRVRDVLERLVGAGHVAVAVNVELDFAKTDRTEETYDRDTAALRSESKIEERVAGTGATAGGVAGARGNLPGAPAPTATVSPDGLTKLSETKNYELSRVVSRIVGPAMQVKKVHVAVLVDQKGETARTPEEMARITALAREAAGLDTERGDRLEVHSAPFAVTADPVADAPAPAAPAPLLSWPPQPQVLIAAGGAGLLLIVAVVFMVISAKRRARRRGRPEVLPALPASIGTVEASLPGAVPTVTATALPAPNARERALAAARSDAPRAARVLSAWLAENVREGGRA